MSNLKTLPVQLDSISKCYRIFQNPQDRFKQVLLDRFPNMVLRKKTTPLYREHWAVRDVSFELQAGDAVGIVGRNGAGKSTLLQIIAGTLAPTSGSVKTSGRITSLLELGCGFNPEFTGRENAFLNAQIIGMSRDEAIANFDEIASFADIGDFIDQPVKTYSSGMMMRLAFAVQTALKPDILIVDEALAVGDQFFQAKCMMRMRRLLDDGVSVLFVSHNVDAVRQICNKAILLKDGILEKYDEVGSVCNEYSKASYAVFGGSQSQFMDIQDKLNTKDDFGELLLGMEAFKAKANSGRIQSGQGEIFNVQMLINEGLADTVAFNETVEIRVQFAAYTELAGVNVAFFISTRHGTKILYKDTREENPSGLILKKGSAYLFKWELDLPMMHGVYYIGASIAFPQGGKGEMWEFVDLVPIGYEFRVMQKASGMIGGLYSPPTTLEIQPI